MDKRADIDRKIGKVRVRCFLNIFLSHAAGVLLAFGIIGTLLLVADRFFSISAGGFDFGLFQAFSSGHGWWIVLALAGLWIVLSGVLAYFRRPTRMQTAVLVDERLSLRERFSTALALKNSERAGESDALVDGAFSDAAIAQADQTAKELTSRNINSHFPIAPTGRWIIAAVPWMAFAMVLLFMPNVDVFGNQAKKDEIRKQKKEVRQVKGQVKQVTKFLKSNINKLADKSLDAELGKIADMAMTSKPDQVRRDAIKRLSALSDKISKMKDSERSAAAKALKEMMKKIKGAPKGGDQKLNQNLARGKFDRVAKDLKDLVEKMKDDKLTKEQKENLKKQLEDLSEQLRELSNKEKQIADSLEESGMNKEDAKKLSSMTEQEIREELKKRGLDDEQIEKVMKKIKSACDAGKKCQELSEELERLCRAGEKNSGDGEKDWELTDADLDDLVSMLEDFDGELVRLGNADATLDEIADAIALLGGKDGKGGSGLRLSSEAARGPWQAGDPAGRRGAGTGGPGRGYGARDTSSTGNTGLRKTGVKNKPKEGPIVASWYFRGKQIKGTSKKKFQNAVQAAKNGASEAVSERKIPKKYEKSVKKYFGQLEETGK